MYKHLYLDHKTDYIKLKKIKKIIEQIGSGQLNASEKIIIKMYDIMQKKAEERKDSFPMISAQYLNDLKKYVEDENNLRKIKEIEIKIKESSKLSELLRTLQKNKEWNNIDELKNILTIPDTQTLTWIINSYITKSINKLEDIQSRLKPAIEKLKLLAKKDSNYTKQLTNITKFAGLKGLEAYLDEEPQKNLLEELIKTSTINKGREGGKVIFDGNDIKIIKPVTKEGACYYGRGTKWCTSATESNNLFEKYNKDGPLYIIQPKNPDKDGKEKYQLHFESEQFMDDKDSPVDLNELIKKYPEIKNVFDDDGLYDHIINSNLLQFIGDENKLKIKNLKMDDDGPLRKGDLPEGLKSLEFNNFNQPIGQGVLPEGLQSLHFGYYFDQPIGQGVLPEGLQSLIFSRYFNQPIGQGVLPTGLQSLEFGYNFNQQIELGVLPEGLQSLIFGNDFNQPIGQGVLPEGLQSLEFGTYFNKLIQSGDLPEGLQSLIFGFFYNSVIDEGVLPEGLKSLDIGDFYYQSIGQGVLPEGLKTISFSERYLNENEPFAPGIIPFGTRVTRRRDQILW
jgi:hypothetical protein